ncbi:MAG TPA: hypothetical protein VGX45_00610, partial [Solirubrobacteraceae bacterium]|nr:hypothetical protein [Solirubrobacteraceae bacterium]
MNQHKASRTLVKSPPELWAECSDASSLTRHLDQFGEITITRLDPETAVAWEGERVSGTVRLEPSGWGTRVTLTAAVDEDPAVVREPEPEPVAEPELVAEPEPEPEFLAEPDPEPAPEPVAPPIPPITLEPTPARPRGLFARLLSRLGPKPVTPLPGPPAPALSGPEPTPTPAVTESAPYFSPPEGGDLEHPDPEVPNEPESEAEPEPEPELTPVVADLLDAEAALVAALDSLGQA